VLPLVLCTVEKFEVWDGRWAGEGWKGLIIINGFWVWVWVVGMGWATDATQTAVRFDLPAADWKLLW